MYCNDAGGSQEPKLRTKDGGFLLNQLFGGIVARIKDKWSRIFDVIYREQYVSEVTQNATRQRLKCYSLL